MGWIVLPDNGRVEHKTISREATIADHLEHSTTAARLLVIRAPRVVRGYWQLGMPVAQQIAQL